MELKHGYYHLIAILVVAIWGLTFISTKVLINHGLTPQEIFFYRFLIAYLGIWVISPKRLFTSNWKDELLVDGRRFFSVVHSISLQRIQLWELRKHPMSLSSFAQLPCLLPFFPFSFIRVKKPPKV